MELPRHRGGGVFIGIISRSLVFVQLLLVSAYCALAQSNPIVVENAKPGNPSSEWDIAGAGDPSIQGFATDISVNKGATIRFKIKTNATSYRLDIYRLGYYGGLGARFIVTVTPFAALPQTQPNPIVDSSTGLVDCGNWAESASWVVPLTATSGIYLAKLVRTDTGGASHIIFVVRDDSSTSNLLFQTADTTWQAYNAYGGNSFYAGSPAGRAYKLSYNRPLTVRGDNPFNGVFNAEYPMIRWLEANGYDVSYTTGVDTDRRGNLLTNHKVFLSVGHDEYWSGTQRANVEAARNAGVHLAFFSGNDIYWKTRWEPSIDGSGTAHRTLVCYKETWANAKIDPNSAWTGTWRDPRFCPPSDGGRPENALSGTLFTVNVEPRADSIAVPASYGKHRFWRNTSVANLAAGETATFAPGTLGYEWNEAVVEGAPPGLMRLSSATVSNVSRIQDYGNNFPPGQQATHNLTLYRHSSGAVVFSAGTVQWSWGLDDMHDGTAGSSAPSQGSASSTSMTTTGVASSFAPDKPGAVFYSEGPPSAEQPAIAPQSAAPATEFSSSLVSETSSIADNRVRQATVNLFADMGAQPGSLQAGLTPATQSIDAAKPSSVILSPAAGTALQTGSQVVISGTATDSGGGHVWGVEVSTDGGATWKPADGRESWTLAWIPAGPGSVTIKTRAVDDIGNLEVPGPGSTVTVAGNQTTLWPSITVPAIVDAGADNPVEVGVKFYSEVGGTISGIRFYKSAANIGSHVGKLWSSTGTLLASTPFSGETTSGWQQANFTTPVPINAFTIYVASYRANSGHYSANVNYFSSIGRDNPPLHAPPTGGSWGMNGVYAYGANSTFPNQTFKDTNYWVDVVLQTGPPPTLTSITVTPSNPTISTGATQQFTATGTYSDSSTQNITSQVTWNSSTPAVATINPSGVASGLSAGSTTISASQSGLTGQTNLTVQTAALTITTGTQLPNGTVNAGYSANLAASGGTPPYTWSIAAGSLPPGLTLALTGAISGTSAATGNFSFDAKVSDASNPSQSATKVLNLTIANASSTIWPSTAVPGTVDSGPDGAVELGVKFRSDVSGTIRGIRFYKASTNTGTHVGNLWSSTGTLLASATFSNETASGWQQVNLSTPVAIAANTTYVASYRTNTGHYSLNANYFANSGVDNAPLHALANSVSANGVYRYGSGSLFPNQTFNSSNYWVDVVFEAGPAPTLNSISVTPVNPSINTGATQQFTATGNYSDGSTQNLTSQVTWTSSSTTVATINSAGLASGVSAGSTIITAAFSGKTGITTLAVQAAPLAITTTSLPNAVLNTAYSASLLGSGGTPPYNWTLSAGALPPGLTLSTSGAISGTPTTAGSYNFTVRLMDNTSQTVTKGLSITVATAAPLTIWPSSTVPGVVDSGPDSAVQLGVTFRSDVAGTIRGIRFYKAPGNTGTHVGSLWSISGTRLANATFTNETASGWQEVLFATPVAISANTNYLASYHTPAGHYSINANYFASGGADNGPLHALSTGAVGGNGVYRYGASNLFPNQTWNASNYWVDVVFQPN